MHIYIYIIIYVYIYIYIYIHMHDGPGELRHEVHHGGRVEARRAVEEQLDLA